MRNIYGKEQFKIAFLGVITSVQPRSNVWRYLVDNRTHSLTGYNLFLKGRAEDEEKEFAVAISEKQQQKLLFHIGDVISGTGWTKKAGKINVSNANGRQWQMLQLNTILELCRSIDSKVFVTDRRTVGSIRWGEPEWFHIKGWGASTMRGGLMTSAPKIGMMKNKYKGMVAADL